MPNFNVSVSRDFLNISSFRDFGINNINTYDGFQHAHDSIFVLNTSLVTFGFLRNNNTHHTS